MLRLNLRRLAKDPFQVLELSRSATKAEVKSKYREMAKMYHPDSPTGDTKRMEEINRAYNLLLKEGAYERFHVKAGAAGAAASSPSRRRVAPRPFGGPQNPPEGEDDVDIEGQFTTNPAGPSGIFGERRHPRPFVDDSAASPLEDLLFAKLVGLDADTERVTPEGKYIYQNKDSGEFVTLDKPLLKAKQTRYETHKSNEEHARKLEEQYRKQQVSSRALWDELTKKTSDAEKRENSKGFIDKLMTRFEATGSLPTRNKVIFTIIVIGMVYNVLREWKNRKPRLQKDIVKVDFYGNKLLERQVVEEQYMENAENFDAVTAAAAIIFLAAASKKSMSDPVVQPLMDEFNYSVPRQIYRILGHV